MLFGRDDERDARVVVVGRVIVLGARVFEAL